MYTFRYFILNCNLLGTCEFTLERNDTSAPSVTSQPFGGQYAKTHKRNTFLLLSMQQGNVNIYIGNSLPFYLIHKKALRYFSQPFISMEALKSHERIHRKCISNDEEEHVKTVFNPAMEKFGPHLMKKCSIFIRRVKFIEDAVLKGDKSIDRPATSIDQIIQVKQHHTFQILVLKHLLLT